MTQQQIETLLTQLQQQVTLNTTAIQQLVDRFNNYATLSNLNTLQSTVTSNSTNISSLQTQVAGLQTSIGLINKISKLIDTNIQNPVKNDLLQWDGDRWTNIQPSKIGISGSGSSGVSTLSGLTDVTISSLSDGQALVWSNTLNKWTNKTIQTGGGSTPSTGISMSDVWSALSASTSEQINPSHITGSLALSGLSVNGSTTLTNGSTQLSVTSSNVTVNGNLLGKSEITAYA